MKKNLVLIGLLTSTISFAQENIIDSIGNVGIGTIVPTEALEVKGNVKIDSNLVLGGEINAPFLVDHDNYAAAHVLLVDSLGNIFKSGPAFPGMLEWMVGLNYCPSDGSPIVNPMWTSGTNKVFIPCSQVKVGIATDNPEVNLDVRGQASTARLSVGLGTPTTMNGRLHIKEGIPSYAGTSEPIIVVENTERKLLVIDNTGLLRTREVLIDTQVWPDYVFEDSYVLMPLSEVEQFIEANGHLPNVPSASEVEANGQSLGEINQILLEKIEELTLHLIEQQKQLDALKVAIQNK